MEQPDHDLLIRVDEKLELLLQQTDSKNNDFEKRIRVLEAFRWQLVGALVVLQSIGDYILYLVLKK